MAKYRSSFVANSSSSSFICDVCERKEEGMDLSIDDAEMMQCIKGHTFCNEEMVGEFPGLEEDQEEYELMYEMPIENCPICQMTEYDMNDMIEYLRITRGASRDEAFAEIKAQNKRRRKIYNREFMDYAFKKFNLTKEKLLLELRVKFKSYEELDNFISEGK